MELLTLLMLTFESFHLAFHFQFACFRLDTKKIRIPPSSLKTKPKFASKAHLTLPLYQVLDVEPPPLLDPLQHGPEAIIEGGGSLPSNSDECHFHDRVAKCPGGSSIYPVADNLRPAWGGNAKPDARTLKRGMHSAFSTGAGSNATNATTYPSSHFAPGSSRDTRLQSGRDLPLSSISILKGLVPDDTVPPVLDGEFRALGATDHPKLAKIHRERDEEWNNRRRGRGRGKWDIPNQIVVEQKVCPFEKIRAYKTLEN